MNNRSTFAGIEIFQPQPGTLYNLETTAQLAGVSRRSLLLYCRSGIIRPELQEPFGALFFNESSIRSVRRVEYLRTIHGINLTGARMILDLLEEVERLRNEVRFYHG